MDDFIAEVRSPKSCDHSEREGAFYSLENGPNSQKFLRGAPPRTPPGYRPGPGGGCAFEPLYDKKHKLFLHLIGAGPHMYVSLGNQSAR